MKSKTQKTEVKSDFKLAKEVVDTLEVFNHIFIEVTKVENFRKYLVDCSKYIGKQYVTKKIEGKLKITRLK